MAETTAKLAAALSKAQARCKAVAHDAKNDFHKYRYTSAEAVIAEGKEALAAEGLALLPTGQSVRVEGDAAAQRFELVRRFALLHASGEERPIEWAWPVVPDRGRPLDKAVAGAATTSLAYLLRDLLLMPRVDEADDLAGREEREQPAPRPQPPVKPRPGLRAWFQQCEDALVAKRAIKPGDLWKHVEELARTDMLDLDKADAWSAQEQEAYRAEVTRWGNERLAAVASEKPTTTTGNGAAK